LNTKSLVFSAKLRLVENQGVVAEELTVLPFLSVNFKPQLYIMGIGYFVFRNKLADWTRSVKCFG